jgi:hypothetical protein
MKKIILGVLIGFGLATTLVMAEQATEQHRGMMGGMMQGMQGMMGQQKPGEQSQDMMQGMKEMMARMSKMMDMCNQMMSNTSHPKKDESSK